MLHCLSSQVLYRWQIGRRAHTSMLPKISSLTLFFKQNNHNLHPAQQPYYFDDWHNNSAHIQQLCKRLKVPSHYKVLSQSIIYAGYTNGQNCTHDHQPEAPFTTRIQQCSAALHRHHYDPGVVPHCTAITMIWELCHQMDMWHGKEQLRWLSIQLWRIARSQHSSTARHCDEQTNITIRLLDRI